MNKININNNKNNSESDNDDDDDEDSEEEKVNVIHEGKNKLENNDNSSDESESDDHNKIKLENSSDDKSKSNTDSKSKKTDEDKLHKSKTIASTSTLDRYTINGFDMILIDNQENSFFPFMFLSFPKIEYSSNTINSFNIINSKMDLQFQIMIYNYVSSIWEPFIEGANCTLINLSDSSNKDHIINRYKLLLNNISEEQKIIKI